MADLRSSLSIPDLERYGQGWLLGGEIRQLSSNTLTSRRTEFEKLIWFLKQQSPAYQWDPYIQAVNNVIDSQGVLDEWEAYPDGAIDALLPSLMQGKSAEDARKAARRILEGTTIGLQLESARLGRRAAELELAACVTRYVEELLDSSACCLFPETLP